MMEMSSDLSPPRSSAAAASEVKSQAPTVEQQSSSTKTGSEETDVHDTLDYDQLMQLQANQLRRDLTYACAVPMLLLVSIGGKPALLTLSFGGVATYLLDLLESVEGSIICLSLTFLSFLACLIFGMRDFITISFLNILVFLVMALSVFFIYLTTICHYNVVLFDVGVFSNLILQVMFGTMPLVFSTVIAGVVSIEVPEFDIITCFNVLYFLYVSLLCRPRLLWRGGKLPNDFRATRLRKAFSSPLLSSSLVRIIISLPLVLSVLASYSIHRNLPMSDTSRWFHFCYSLFLPRFLMAYCVHDHKEVIVDDEAEFRKGEEMFFVVTMVGLGFFLPSHPWFDEIKLFCDQPEPMPSVLLSTIGMLLAIVALLHKRIYRYRMQARVDGGLGTGEGVQGFKERFTLTIMKFVQDFLIAVATVLTADLINLPQQVRPMAIIGVVTVSELYHKDDWNLVSRLLLGVMSFLAVVLTFDSFAKDTLYHLNYKMLTSSLAFFAGDAVSLEDFCWATTVLLATSTVAPSCISYGKGLSRADLDEDSEESILPSAHNASNPQWLAWSQRRVKAYLVTLGHYFYGIALGAVSFALLYYELLVLEQDWSAMDIDSTDIYPSEYFLLSAALILITVFATYRARVLSIVGAILVSLFQVLKLLYFYDFDAHFIVALALVLFIALLPFLRQIDLAFQSLAQVDTLEYNAQAYAAARERLLLPFHELVTNYLCVLFTLLIPEDGRYIARVCLSLVLAQEGLVAVWQEWMLTASFALIYAVLMLVVFQPEQTSLRSILLGLATVFALVAFEGFGTLPVTSLLSATSLFAPTSLETSAEAAVDSGFIHQLLLRGHGQFFFLLSGLLTLAAWLQYFSLESFVSSLLYSVVFGYISTKAMIDWAFPVTLSEAFVATDANGQWHLREHLYPFLFLLVTKSLNTFVALWSRRDKCQSYAFAVSYYLALLLPWLAVLWEMFSVSDSSPVLMRESHTRRTVGIIWSTLMAHLAILVGLRGRELLFLVQGGIIVPTSNAAGILAVNFDLVRANLVKYYYSTGSGSNGKQGMLPTHLIPLPGTAGTSSAVLLLAFDGLLWALFALYANTSTLDADLLFPAVALLMLLPCDGAALSSIFSFGNSKTDKRGDNTSNVSAILVWSLLCVVWWYASLGYHVFYLHSHMHTGLDIHTVQEAVRLHDQARAFTAAHANVHLEVIMPYSVFGWDSNVSIWSCDSLFVPLLNLFLAMVPLPGLVLVFSSYFSSSTSRTQITKEYNVQDDALVVLGLICITSLVGASVDCVRYLSLLTLVLCVHRSYGSQSQRYSGSSGQSDISSLRSGFTAAVEGRSISGARDRFL